FPSMARTMLPTVGFGWTMRAIGFVQLATLGVALAAVRAREMPRGKGPLFDLTPWTELEYNLYAAGAFLVCLNPLLDMCVCVCVCVVWCVLFANPSLTSQSFVGIFFPFFYLASYAREIQHL